MLERHVKLAMKGNHDSFVKIIRDVEGSLYRVAKGILRSEADCADAIQDTIIKAHENIGTLKNPAYFKTWITRILINQCNTMLQQKKRIVLVPTIFDQKTGMEQINESAEVWEAIDLLPEEMKVTVILFYIEGWSLKETAEILQIAEGTVKSRLARARLKLAASLSPTLERGAENER